MAPRSGAAPWLRRTIPLRSFTLNRCGHRLGKVRRRVQTLYDLQWSHHIYWRWIHAELGSQAGVTMALNGQRSHLDTTANQHPAAAIITNSHGSSNIAGTAIPIPERSTSATLQSQIELAPPPPVLTPLSTPRLRLPATPDSDRTHFNRQSAAAMNGSTVRGDCPLGMLSWISKRCWSETQR